MLKLDLVMHIVMMDVYCNSVTLFHKPECLNNMSVYGHKHVDIGNSFTSDTCFINIIINYLSSTSTMSVVEQRETCLSEWLAVCDLLFRKSKTDQSKDKTSDNMDVEVTGPQTTNMDVEVSGSKMTVETSSQPPSSRIFTYKLVVYQVL